MGKYGDDIHPGAELMAEEIAFGAAVERYKRERQRPFPTWSEVLAVARALGYRRVAEPTESDSRRAARDGWMRRRRAAQKREGA